MVIIAWTGFGLIVYILQINALSVEDQVHGHLIINDEPSGIFPNWVPLSLSLHYMLCQYFNMPLKLVP